MHTGGSAPDGAWGHLTRVQADAVRATAAATGSNPDELARDLVPILHIPPGSATDAAEDG